MFWNADLVPFSSIIREHWSAIAQECDQVIESTPLWRETEIYEGTWRLFVFYDYETGGTEAVPQNLARCPETSRILDSIPGRHAASFSALGPRSRIKPHVGLDHGLLRFHCGLRVPTACTLSAMGEHAGLESRHVRSIAALLTALRQPALPIDCFWRYAPSSLPASIRIVTSTGEGERFIIARTLEGIQRLIDDVTFICHSGEVFGAIDEHHYTAIWAAVLESEDILHRAAGAAPIISISYPSQVQLVRWFNTAIVTELLFPNAFEKSLIFDRRILTQQEACLFNDAFVHEARNNSDELRVVLLIDFERARYGLTTELLRAGAASGLAIEQDLGEDAAGKAGSACDEPRR